MIVERSTHPQFVSNTYLLADGEGGPGVLHRRRRPGRAADRGGRAARARRPRTCCSPTTTSTTSARSARCASAGPGCEVLISAREHELLGDAEPRAPRRGRRAMSDRGRRAALPLRRARGARAAHARPHRRDALVPGQRARGPTASGAAAPGACSPATRCSRTPSAACERPGHTHLRRPARLDHGDADGAAPEHRHLPGPRGRDARSRASGSRTPSSASGAAWTPRAPSPARRSASPPRSCCSAPTTTAAPRRGCAGRTAPTTSCPARSVERAQAPGAAGAGRARRGRRGPVAWRSMARENEKIPTSRARRTATVATLAASEAVKQFGTRAANLTRDEEASEEAMSRRQLETAKQIVAVLGTMKGAAMKLGQVMSFLDVGLVAEEHREEFQRELAKLRDAAPTVSFKQMRARDRGGPRRADLARCSRASRRSRSRPPRSGRSTARRSPRTAARSRSRSSTRASPPRCAPTCRTWT